MSNKDQLGGHSRNEICAHQGRGYLYQRADERLGGPTHRVDLGAFSGQKQRWKTPRGLPGSALSLCV